MRTVAVTLAVVASLAWGVLPATAQSAPTVEHVVVESFDGTPIEAHLFLPPGAADEAPVPLIMHTHGWAGSGAETPAGFDQRLLDAGYGVLTWDARGFGCSGGEVQIDKPGYEGRDASALIDWAVANAPIATVEGDPIVGFVGGSYAGGIQTATAAFDPRIDAIAPEISWADLRYALDPGGVLELGWIEVLYDAGVATAHGEGLDPSCPTFPQTGGLAQPIHEGYANGAATNTASEDTLAYFAESSLAFYGQDHPVTIPTLVINGSVDTLFDLTGGAAIFHHVRDHGAPAKFIAFCGGHVSCPTTYADADDATHVEDAILTWFDRYLLGRDVDTGAPVEYRTNAGEWRTAADFTPPDAAWLEAQGEGTLPVTPLTTTIDVASLVQELQASGGTLPPNPLIAAQPSQDGDPHAFTVEVAAADDGPLEVVGVPTATLEVAGTGPTAHLFVKLVHREAGVVLNLQEGAVRVTDLSADAQTVEVTMPGLAYTIPEGDHLDLQVATTSVMHTLPRTPGQVEVAATVEVPVRRAAAAPAGGGSGSGSTDGSGGAGPGSAGGSSLPSTGGGLVAFALPALALAERLRRR